MAGGYVHTLAPVKNEEREKEIRRLEKIEKRLAQEYGMASRGGIDSTAVLQEAKSAQKECAEPSWGRRVSAILCGAKKEDLQKLLDLRFEHANDQSVPSRIPASQQIINGRKVASHGAINSVAADLQGAKEVFESPVQSCQ